LARILWLGDAACHTGFARVTHAIGERLIERGHDVHVLARNHKGDYWDTTLKLYVPTMRDPKDYYGRSRILDMLALEPDVVVMLGDPWEHIQILFENPYDPKRLLLQYRPILGYIPIDGINNPPNWDLLEKCMKRVAMTKWGQEAMPEAPVVYHGVDTDTFHPVSSQEPLTLSNGMVVTTKRECKQAFGFDPDGFLVLRIDTNTVRKDYPASWKALVPFLKRHSDVQVHFHCVKGHGNASVNMEALLGRDPDTKGRFFFPDMVTSSHGWPVEDLVGLMNAADVFLSTSRGEGFGLTLAEAAACGVPVIAQNVSAIPEVVGSGGVLVDPLTEITFTSAQDHWLADIPAFTEALEHLYTAGGVRRKLGLEGRDHVRKFKWDFAADRFHEFLEELAHGQAAPSGDEVQRLLGTPQGV